MHVRSCRRLRSSTSPNVLIAATVLSIVAAATAPPPHAPIPRDPVALAARLNETDAGLEAAIDGWKHRELGRPPRDVTLLALYQQRIYIVLFGRPGLAAAALARLPARRAAQLLETLLARADLLPLSRPRPLSAFRTAQPLPAGLLLRDYREAERRVGGAREGLPAGGLRPAALRE